MVIACNRFIMVIAGCIHVHLTLAGLFLNSTSVTAFKKIDTAKTNSSLVPLSISSSGLLQALSYEALSKLHIQNTLSPQQHKSCLYTPSTRVDHQHKAQREQMLYNDISAPVLFPQ